AEADARREVTNKDLETIDSAISSHEGLGRFLYTTRRILGEIGKLEEHYRGLKEGITMVEQEGGRINAELEHAKSELAKVKREEVETRKGVAELTREAEEKQRELSAYSMAVDKIMGKVAA